MCNASPGPGGFVMMLIRVLWMFLLRPSGLTAFNQLSLRRSLMSCFLGKGFSYKFCPSRTRNGVTLALIAPHSARTSDDVGIHYYCRLCLLNHLICPCLWGHLSVEESTGMPWGCVCGRVFLPPVVWTRPDFARSEHRLQFTAYC